MNKNNIIISRLCALFLLLASSAMAFAQATEGNENYYSNPKKGIKPSAPNAFVDTAVTSKSDNITVDLTGFIPDTNAVKDSTPSDFRLDRRSLQAEGYSLYPSTPWYSGWYGSWYGSLCDPWYYSWGFDPWMYPRCWSCGHYWGWDSYWGWGGYWGFGFHWGFGPYWSYGWGHPWYWNSYYYNAFYAGYYLGRGHDGYGYGNRGGYGLLNESRGKGNTIGRGGSGVRTTSSRGTVRRGGVDLNSGGRAPHGRVSGTGTVDGRNVSAGSRSASVASRTSTGRYARPAAATTGRNTSTESRGFNASRGTSYSRSATSSRSNLNNSSRSSYRGSSFSAPSRTSNSSYRTNSSSSRSSSSSFRSSSSSSRSSSSSFRSSGSSSFRSSGGSGFRSSGSSHSGGSFRGGRR